jgi:DNA polymerase-1
MIWLIDANNWYHADMHTVGAAGVKYLTQQRIAAIVRKYNPDRIVACIDSGRTFRHDLFADYKAGRKRHPEESLAREEAIEAYDREKIEVAETQGFEADDEIATLTNIAVSAGHRVVVASSDADLHQLLLDGQVTILKKLARWHETLTETWFREKDFRKKFGMSPEQWVDYRMLVGDSSDNISGVRGIGKKYAQAVIQDCGSIEGFFRSPEKADVSDTVREKIMQAKDQMPYLRELIELRCDVPSLRGHLGLAEK